MVIDGGFFSIGRMSGFLALTDCEIYQNGKLWYQCDRGKKFNMPRGNFSLFGKIEKCEPINYSVDFFVSNHPITRPVKLKINSVSNPHKCTVFPETGETYLDHNFEKYPTFFSVFVLLHEKGHSYYSGEGQKSEIECDNFAKKIMLENGFNPSQIAYCQDATLKDNLRKTITRHQMKHIKANERN